MIDPEILEALIWSAIVVGALAIWEWKFKKVKEGKDEKQGRRGEIGRNSR